MVNGFTRFKGHPGAIFDKIGHKQNRSSGVIGVVRVILTAYLKGRAFIFVLVVELGQLCGRKYDVMGHESKTPKRIELINI